METRQDWPPWGRLIDETRDRLRPAVSQNEAARRADVTGTHWRQVVKGIAPMTGERGARTIARMAQVVGVTPEQLEEAERPDAAKELRMLLGPESSPEDEPDSLAEGLRKAEELMVQGRRLMDEAQTLLAELRRDENREGRRDIG